MSIWHPRKRWKLIYIICHRRSKIVRLILLCFLCQSNIIFHFFLHRNIHRLKKFCISVKICKWCMNSFKNGRLTIHKTTAKRLYLICTLCYRINKRKGKRIVSFLYIRQKICYIHVKGYTILRLNTVSKYFIVHRSFPCWYIDELHKHPHGVLCSFGVTLLQIFHYHPMVAYRIVNCLFALNWQYYSLWNSLI